ncbi:MAG: HIT domain-containing protein [Gammaproteobacteria bacterium]|nr:HIT domain-containing protein [Gammaproteobacteria bacterium]
MNTSQILKLDPRLANDCFVLGQLKTSQLLLLNNSLVPWFILVPDTVATEIYELPHDQQLELLEEINIISNHMKQNFAVDKLNIAAIGNIVNQMHIHIVGRHVDDYCWPGVVWGADGKQAYQNKNVEEIKSRLTKKLPDVFTAS